MPEILDDTPDENIENNETAVPTETDTSAPVIPPTAVDEAKDEPAAEPAIESASVSTPAPSAESTPVPVPAPARVEKPKRFFHWLRKYGVDKKEPVVLAGEQKAEEQKDSNIAKDPNERIEAYLDDFKDIFIRSDKKMSDEERKEDDAKRKERVNGIKPFLYNAYIIKEEDFPESYFLYQQNKAKEENRPEIILTPEYRRAEYDKNAKAQRETLDMWVDYITSDDIPFSPAIKYFVFKGALTLGGFEDEKIKNDQHEVIDLKYWFNGRNKNTVSAYPRPDHEALGYVMQTIENIYEKSESAADYVPTSELERLVKSGASFSKIYAEALRELDLKSGAEKMWEETEGEWRVFPQSDNPDDHKALLKTFENQRSFLCIGIAESYAASYLHRGDMHVYYSKDRNGQYTCPRAAVSVSYGQVNEVRGTYNSNEDLDPYIPDVVNKHLETLPGGDKYFKKVADMKTLTEVSKKVEAGEELTPEDVKFLYELDSKIEGFGFQRDERIAVARSKLNFFEQFEKIETITPEEKENAAVYMAQAIVGSGLSDSEKGRALNYVIDNGGEAAATSMAAYVDKKVFSQQDLERVWSFIISKGGDDTAMKFVYSVCLVNHSDSNSEFGTLSEENKAKAWKLIYEKGGEKTGQSLAFLISYNDLSPENSEKVWAYLHEKPSNEVMKTLINAMGEGDLSDEFEEKLWKLVEEKGDDDTISMLVSGLKYGDIQIEKVPKVWELIYSKGGDKTAEKLLDGVIERFLSKEETDQVLDFVIEKGGTNTATILLFCISINTIPQEYLEKVNDFINNTAGEEEATYIGEALTDLDVDDFPECDPTVLLQFVCKKGGKKAAEFIQKAVDDGVFDDEDRAMAEEFIKRAA